MFDRVAAMVDAETCKRVSGTYDEIREVLKEHGFHQMGHHNNTFRRSGVTLNIRYHKKGEYIVV